MTESFVVDLIQLAAQGNCSADVNPDVFVRARELLCEREENNEPLLNFEDIAPFLKAHNCSAADAFNSEVTAETDDAFVAYLLSCSA